MISLMITLLFISSLASISCFAKGQTFILNEAESYENISFFAIDRAVFGTEEGYTIVISCTMNIVSSDKSKVTVYKHQDNRYIKQSSNKFKVKSSDDCSDELQSVIRSLEEGQKIEMQIGMTGMSYKEI